MTLTTDGIITANTGDLKLEEKDYIFTVIDTKGNQMQFKITITFGIEASAVTASMYGAEVKGYTSASAGVDKWRIFHSDGTNIYLIADYYVPNTYLPETSEDSSSPGATLTLSGTYEAHFNSSVLSRYTGSEWIRSHQSAISNKWLTWVNSYPGGYDNHIKAVAYMLDTKAWSKFADSRYTEYVIGGPTLEMYCESYKVTHPSKYIEWNSDDQSGYRVKWSTDSSYRNSVSGLNTTKEYNGIYITESSYTNAKGYWLASPGHGDALGRMLMTTRHDGYVISKYIDFFSGSWNRGDCGIRPVVCLKSGVGLQDNGDGTYSIN